MNLHYRYFGATKATLPSYDTLATFYCVSYNVFILYNTTLSGNKKGQPMQSLTFKKLERGITLEEAGKLQK